MQNICSINKDTSLLREDNEKNLESKPNSSKCVQRSLSTEEKYYSDSELKIISKKRSPFVRAFRSFSRSSSSKGKLRCTLKKNKSTEVSNQSNGDEIFDESLGNIEGKQRRKIILGALAKPKVVPSVIVPSDAETTVESKKTNCDLHDLSKITDSRSENNDSEASTENKQRLQIIISGKKIDPHICSERESIQSLVINNTEAKTDICFHSLAIGRTDPIDQKSNNKTREKKFKSKKITSVVALTHRKKEPRPSISKESLYSSVSQEKITITQNLCDTPPSERAPSKPSITATEGEKKVANTGTLSKSIPRSAIPTNSVNNRRYSSLNQRIETNIKKLPPGDHSNIAEVVASKPHGQDISKNLPPNKVKSNLMQEPSSSINRGHRFPKPSKVLAVIGKETKSGHTKSKNTGNEKSISEKQTQPSQSILLEHTCQRSEIESNCTRLDSLERPSKAESIEINERAECFESGENLADSNSEIQNSSKESRRRIRYVAPSIFDVYDSLTASSAIEQTEKVNLGVISEDKLDNKCDEISKESMSNSVNLSKDVQIEAVIMASNNPINTEKREHLYKILVIGELGCGKTSFIKRYVHQFFSQNYRATIGVDFALKVLQWDPNTIVRLQLWDIAGQERFGNMTRVYYKEAVGAFIVFDVTRSGTFECVSKWKDDLDSKVQLPDGSPIPCILLANKCDQEKQGPVTSNDKMDEYVRENGFTGWFETSAKENINIDEAAKALVNKILLNDKLISASELRDSEKFNLNTSTELNDKEINSKCAC